MKLNLNLTDPKQKQNPKSSNRYRRLLPNSNLRTFVVFLFLSFAFWLLQSMQREVVRRVHIPITYDSLLINQELTDSVPQYVELEVLDKGIEHIRYSLGDFDTIRLGYFTEYKREFLGISAKAMTQEINQRLSSSAQVQQQSIRDIRIALQIRASKRVPLQIARPIRTADGFVALSTTLSSDSIVIYGERAQLDTISSIALEVSEPDIPPRQSLTVQAKPQLPPSVSSRTKDVQIRVEVDELTEQAFVLPIGVLNAPAGFHLAPLPGSVTITLTLPRSRYNELVSTDIELAVDYRDVLKEEADGDSTLAQLQVHLVRSPQWVVSYHIQPEVVQYVLERE